VSKGHNFQHGNSFSQLQNSAIMDWVRESGSLLGYPFILFLHTIGLATVAGLNGATRPASAGRRLQDSSQLAEPLLFLSSGSPSPSPRQSGLTLLIADAESMLGSAVFYVKIGVRRAGADQSSSAEETRLHRSGLDTQTALRAGEGAGVVIAAVPG
jgi:hypothetical protein